MVSWHKLVHKLMFDWLWLIVVPWLNNIIVYVGFGLELIVCTEIGGVRVE
jgi:hypothetical protein